MKKYLIALVFLSTIQFYAQEIAAPTKGSYNDKDGKLYWNKDLPVYLRISATPEGEGQLLNSTKSKEYTNPMYLDTEGLNYIRSRYAVDPETKKAIVPNQEILWEIYADGTAPKSVFIFSETTEFTNKGKQYYGKGLTGLVSSKDELSGIEKTYLSVNEKPFSDGNNRVEFAANGEYTLKFYAVDKVGNGEIIKTKQFIVDVDPPKTYYNVNGLSDDNVLGTSAKIYLTSEDEISGVKNTFYQLDGKGFKTYSGKDIPFAGLDDGRHTLEYYSEDNLQNKEAVQKFEFYYDKSAPITTADILGDRFIVDEKVYFSGRTKMKLTAVDNKSGVKDILYSINGETFESYSEPFYLPSISGEHTVLYYSQDDMGNKSGGNGYDSYKHNVSKVYVDLSGPVLSHQLNGTSFKTRDTIFISPRTKITLKAKDPESGLKSIAYSIDNALDETLYDGPFTVSKSGQHLIEIIGYDNVKNRNTEVFDFIVDSNPPEITSNFSTTPTGTKEGIAVYPSFTFLYLAATDFKVGVDRIYYTINGGSKKMYTAPIQGLSKGEKYDIEVYALDNLGNESKKTITFFIEDAKESTSLSRK
jgi:hypothetical protein